MRPVATAAATRSTALSRAARSTVETLEGRQLFAISYLGDAVFAAAGDSPAIVAVGDFNADGRPDAAVANGASKDVTVLMNNGSGTLAANGAPLALGYSPNKVRVTDVDADGKADLAVSEAGGAAMKIFRGNGDGTFAAAVDFNLDVSRNDVEFADLNGDARPELIASISGGRGVVVWQNTGVGAQVKFENKVIYPGVDEAYDPEHIAVADVNGDGKLDLVPVSYSGGGINVMLNNGDGTFATGTHTDDSLGSSDPIFSTVVDLNGDGRMDVVALENSGGHYVYLQQAGGSFAVGAYVPAIGGEGSTVADLNGDGKLDLVTGNTTYGAVTVNHGNGDGTFANDVSEYISFSTVNDTAVADFNGDGKLDVLFADAKNDQAGILFNTSTGGGNTGGGGGGGGGTTPAGSVDLAAQSVSGLKSKLKAGDKAKASIRFNNDGDKALDGKVTVELYASTDTTLDGGDRRLGRLSKSLKLAAKRGASLAVNFKMPKLADGAYNILAKVIGSGDSAATNDVTVMSNQLTVATPKVDLAAAITSLPSLKAGNPAKAAVKISNVGGLLAKGTANVKYYASTDGTLNGAVEIGKAAQKLNLKGGKSANASVNLNVPADLAGQQRFLVAVVTFGKDANATNNTVASASPVTIA